MVHKAFVPLVLLLFLSFFLFCSSHKLCLQEKCPRPLIHLELIHKIAPENTAIFNWKLPTKHKYLCTRLYVQSYTQNLVLVHIDIY